VEIGRKLITLSDSFNVSFKFNGHACMAIEIRESAGKAIINISSPIQNTQCIAINALHK